MNKIPVEVRRNVVPEAHAPGKTANEFRRWLRRGYALSVDGMVRNNPMQLLRSGYTPKHEVRLFDVRVFLCNQRDAESLKVMPAYVLTEHDQRIHARVFYKDSSLVWRSASHYINTHDEHWIGKGAERWIEKRGVSGWYSAEETTNLPLELQAALDEISQRSRSRRSDNRVLPWVLRNAPSDRMHPYHDFTAPRERAMGVAANQVNANKTIAWFDDEMDPTSLQFVDGFQPDFSNIIDLSQARSSMYGGPIQKYRVASENRQIQYMFVAGPKHVWIINPQPFTTEISSYGLRTVDALVDEDLCIPGYEFSDTDGSGDLDDQIPPGFAGDICPVDNSRADASPWNEKMPVIREFRRKVL